jgi:predicted AlkP superfamily phosphohydrolase/phosphomutase
MELTASLENPRLDWQQTPAFMTPCDHHGHIRLNIRGREREGIIEPGEADELKRRIADGLASFRDPDGSPSVAGVDDVGALFGDQPRADWLPDLIVRWSERPATRLTTLSSPEYGEVRRRGTTGRSGAHTADAWATVVPGTSRLNDLGRTPRVADIPATACAVLGAGTEGMSGETLLQPA